MKIDHIVRERYPTFIDAVKDLDDCLTLLFLFSTFPSLRLIPREQSALCRRLTIEFLHYIIASQSLRKVFISIKGYYFQADIKGQKVTWIVPHYYPFKPHSKAEVDFKVMSIFVEFYTIMLGFVNFRLYHSINLAYPPQFPVGVLQDTENTLKDESSFVSDRIAALNFELMRTDKIQDDEGDNEIDMELLQQDGDSNRVIQIKQEAQANARLRSLFKGLKFFISREVPREPLVVLIRSFGGKVSWDRTIFSGAVYDENDETITHEIVDRPSLPQQYISRDYIQPQWVFDSVNQRKLLPTNKYFIGVPLPPHLSPFVDPKRESYIPPEEKELLDPSLIETHGMFKVLHFKKFTDSLIIEQSDAESSSDSDEDKEEEDKEENQQLIDEQLQRAFQQEAKECDEHDDNGSEDEYDEDEVEARKESKTDEEQKEEIRQREVS